MGGMRIGGKHNWKYKQKSIQTSGNSFKIHQTKKRTRPAPSGSGMNIGSKLIWNIKAKQIVKKIGKNLYQVILKGYKGQGAYKTPNMKKWR